MAAAAVTAGSEQLRLRTVEVERVEQLAIELRVIEQTLAVLVLAAKRLATQPLAVLVLALVLATMFGVDVD